MSDIAREIKKAGDAAASGIREIGAAFATSSTGTSQTFRYDNIQAMDCETTLRHRTSTPAQSIRQMAQEGLERTRNE